ncbi:hypothetical protein RF11_01040 [Thelohanellus kitauei]|uniref:Uncharacterized protein n=1 Tax=Thelohanellus kitauei TaxID=669202 RepID=A0A0C2IBE2_THEKT|nr:hypothetical protein RF11_01040 [Thelohanellus kitauei]
MEKGNIAYLVVAIRNVLGKTALIFQQNAPLWDDWTLFQRLLQKQLRTEFGKMLALDGYMNSVIRTARKEYVRVNLEKYLDQHMKHFSSNLKISKDQAALTSLCAGVQPKILGIGVVPFTLIHKVEAYKCKFLQDKIKYLGHVIDEKGIFTTSENIEKIMNCPETTNTKELKSFHGAINYYSKNGELSSTLDTDGTLRRKHADQLKDIIVVSDSMEFLKINEGKVITDANMSMDSQTASE